MNHKPGKPWLIIAALAIVLVTGACGVGEDTALTGTYSLRSVNDERLPASIFKDSQSEVLVLSAAVRLDADFSYIDARLYRIAQGSSSTTQTDTVRGTYVLNGDKVDMTSTSGEASQMVWGGSRLTQYLEGLTYKYEK